MPRLQTSFSGKDKPSPEPENLLLQCVPPIRVQVDTSVTQGSKTAGPQGVGNCFLRPGESRLYAAKFFKVCRASPCLDVERPFCDNWANNFSQLRALKGSRIGVETTNCPPSRKAANRSFGKTEAPIGGFFVSQLKAQRPPPTRSCGHCAKEKHASKL